MQGNGGIYREKGLLPGVPKYRANKQERETLTVGPAAGPRGRGGRPYWEPQRKVTGTGGAGGGGCRTSSSYAYCGVLRIKGS